MATITRGPYECWRCGRFVVPGNGHHVMAKVPDSWSVDLDTGEISWKYHRVRVGPDCIHYMRAEGFELVGDGPETVADGHTYGAQPVKRVR